MGFNNPYMKNPDFGSGISDIINQITQLLMLKKMGGGQQPQGQADTPIPQKPNLGGATMAQVQGGMGQMPGMAGMGQPQQPQASSMMGQGMNKLSPEIMQMLLKMFGGGQGQMGGGGGYLG